MAQKWTIRCCYFQARNILDEKYLRVTSDLLEANDDMDDTSSQNLEALKQLGDYWWDTYGAQTIELLRKNGKLSVVGGITNDLLNLVNK